MGFGFRGEFPRFSTVVAVPAESALPGDRETYQQELGGAFDVRAVVHDPEAARRLVLERQVDAAVVVDAETVRRLRAGETGTARVYYNEVNPQRASWVQYFSSGQSAEINRRLVSAALASREPELAQVRAAAQRAEAALNEPGLAATPSLAAARDNLRTVNQALERYAAVGPEGLLTPLEVEAENLAPIEPNYTAYYAPAVVALLLQHLTMTVASLSIVRERTLGLMEVFRVAPVSPLELVLGKYLGYALFAALIVVALVALLVYGLNVPLLGRPDQLAVVVALLTLASLGLGMAVSAIARTETQVVQVGMLILLLTVFFSGFVVPLDQFWEPIRAISYSLPATHGAAALQLVMLRGVAPTPLSLGALAGMAIALALVAVIAVQRDLRSI